MPKYNIMDTMQKKTNQTFAEDIVFQGLKITLNVLYLIKDGNELTN